MVKNRGNELYYRNLRRQIKRLQRAMQLPLHVATYEDTLESAVAFISAWKMDAFTHECRYTITMDSNAKSDGFQSSCHGVAYDNPAIQHRLAGCEIDVNSPVALGMPLDGLLPSVPTANAFPMAPQAVAQESICSVDVVCDASPFSINAGSHSLRQ